MADGFDRLVGSSIRAARNARGWTQVFLAERAELSPNYIARLERGELGPSLRVACQIASALEMSLDDLASASAPASRRGR